MFRTQAPEAQGRELGSVTVWVGAEERAVAKPHAAMEAAFKCGERLAARSGALPGIAGLTKGMLQLETNFWNDKRTRLPGWVWMLNMPKVPESPAFVEAMVVAAGMRRGIPGERVQALAAAAAADAGAPTQRARPEAETLEFAMLCAEGVYLAVTRARYLTDAYDTNKPNGPWRVTGLEPVECMTANIREDGADDCEGFAAGVASLMYGIANGDASASAVHTAARAVCRCWVPMVTLGQAVRWETNDPNMAQYNTGDGMNAHSWTVLLPTSAARTAMAPPRRPDAPASARVRLSPIMLDPWRAGLPVLLVDCTMTCELYPRSWGGEGEDGADPLARVAHALRFPSALRPLDATFHRVLRNGYTPYGVVGADGSPAYELYWYTVEGARMRYGTPTVDAFRLPHTPPPGFCTSPAPRSPLAPASGTPWLAASVVPTPQDMEVMRPAILEMHPVRPVPAPAAQDRAAAAALLEAVRHLPNVVCTPPPPVDDPWGAPPATVCVRYGDASDAGTLAKLISRIRGMKLYAHTQLFWGGEPQLWLTPRRGA